MGCAPDKIPIFISIEKKDTNGITRKIGFKGCARNPQEVNELIHEFLHD